MLWECSLEHDDRLRQFTYCYDPARGLLQTVNLPNGETANYTCYGVNEDWRLNALQRKLSTTEIFFEKYTYADNGNLLPRLERSPGVASWANAVARTGLPGLCGRAACAPGRSAVSGLAPPTLRIEKTTLFMKGFFDKRPTLNMVPAPSFGQSHSDCEKAGSTSDSSSVPPDDRRAY